MMLAVMLAVMLAARLGGPCPSEQLGRSAGPGQSWPVEAAARFEIDLRSQSWAFSTHAQI